MRTGNPTLNDKIFSKYNNRSKNSHDVMTIDGTTNKTLLLFVLLLIPAAFTWSLIMDEQTAPLASLLMIGGVIGGLIFAIITAFKREWAPFTAPAYAIFEGFFIGGISAVFESKFPGIVIQAVALTFGVMFALLFIYKARIIKVTENFRIGLFAATGAIALIYLASFILGFFGINVPYIHESGWIGIGFSLVVVTIAALNLVLDFDFIENAAEAKVPKFMEWYGAFGLMVTLVWLYIEILRLLSKLYSRD